MKKKMFLAGMLSMALVFGLVVISCPTDTIDDGKSVPEKLRGTWTKGTAYITFGPATVSFGAGSTQSSVYTVTKVSDSSIFVELDGKEKTFANYSMPDSSSLTLSGGELHGSALVGTYTKDME